MGTVGVVFATLAVAGSGSASEPSLRLSVVPRVGLVDRVRRSRSRAWLPVSG